MSSFKTRKLEILPSNVHITLPLRQRLVLPLPATQSYYTGRRILNAIIITTEGLGIFDNRLLNEYLANN